MVPMIELEDGTQIGEGLAIWTYLETLYPQPALMGTTALEKALISAWERRAYDEGMVGHAEIFRNSHPTSSTVACRVIASRYLEIPALIDRGKLRVARFHKSSMNSWRRTSSWPATSFLLPTSLRSRWSISVTLWRCKFRMIART